MELTTNTLLTEYALEQQYQRKKRKESRFSLTKRFKIL